MRGDSHGSSVKIPVPLPSSIAGTQNPALRIPTLNHVPFSRNKNIRNARAQVSSQQGTRSGQRAHRRNRTTTTYEQFLQKSKLKQMGGLSFPDSAMPGTASN